jgi:hypothetical protein
MKKIIIFTISLVLLSCKPNTTNEKTNTTTKQEIVNLKGKKIAPLISGTEKLTDDIFGEIIELKGTSRPIDKFFKISETQLLVVDSILLVKNKHEGFHMMAYSLPDYKFLKSFCISGNGPMEFHYVKLVKDESRKNLCYLYDMISTKFYAVNRNFELKPVSKQFNKQKNLFSDKQLHVVNEKSFFYEANAKGGKAIFHSTLQNDSLQTKQVKHLAFNKKRKGWANYIGDFGMSDKNKRIVYAYKYFKRLMFYDYEHDITKELIFEQKKKNKKKGNRNMLGPSNTTYYWGISTTDDYIYNLYSGRTPIEVRRGYNKNPNGFTEVSHPIEQGFL